MNTPIAHGASSIISTRARWSRIENQWQQRPRRWITKQKFVCSGVPLNCTRCIDRGQNLSSLINRKKSNVFTLFRGAHLHAKVSLKSYNKTKTFTQPKTTTPSFGYVSLNNSNLFFSYCHNIWKLNDNSRKL